MALEKIARIVLKRCDVTEESKFQSSQSYTSNVKIDFSEIPPVRIKIENEFDPAEPVGAYGMNAVGPIRVDTDKHAPAVRIKIENEFEFTENVKTENGISDPIRTPVDNDEQYDNYVQGHAVIKTEDSEEKGKITEELIGYLPRSLEDSECDEKILLNIVKCEKNDIGTGNEFEYSFENQTVGTSNAGIDKKSKEVCRLKKNIPQLSHTKTEEKSEEKGQITKNLVGYLPGSLKNKCDEKSLLKIVNCERNDADIGDEFESHFGNTVHPSTACSMKFRTNRKLKSHRTTHNAVITHKCPRCSCGFERLSSLKNHLHVHLNEKLFSCPQCGAEFKAAENLSAHLKTHSKKLFACTECSTGAVTFRRRSELKKHIISRHTTEKLYTCAHCFKKFKRKQEVTLHMVTHSNETPHSCPKCPKKFKLMYQMKIHMRLHSGAKPYACNVCAAKFSRRGAFTSHLATHSAEKPFGCNECPRKFKTRGQLRMHKITHVTQRCEERSFCCAQCPGKYKTKLNLCLHIKKVHIGLEKRHACDTCPYKTYSADHLKAHLLSHSTVQPFSCNQCRIKFKTLRNLELHKGRVHTNERSFKCDKCPATFKGKNNLTSHMLRHSKENRYACPECTFTFKSSRSLKTHSSEHTDERKYSCEQCPKKFKMKGDLEKHLSTHTGEKPYKCSYCSKRYARKGNLLVHIKRHLQEKLPSN